MSKRKRLLVRGIKARLPQVINITVWQDEDRIWLEIDRVYETRWDCLPVPERVRRAA